MRSKRQRGWLGEPHERAEDLGSVLVCEDLVGAQVLVDLDEGVAVAALTARPGDPALRVDDEAFGLHEPFANERSHGQQRGRWVAAGVGHDGVLGRGPKKLWQTVVGARKPRSRRMVEP